MDAAATGAVVDEATETASVVDASDSVSAAGVA